MQLPCKFFYDSTSLTNILFVILSGHIQRNLITVLPDSSQNLAFPTTGLKSVVGTQVANNLWTLIYHTVSLLTNCEFKYIRSSKHSRILQLSRDLLLLQHRDRLPSIQLPSYSILKFVFLLYISHVYTKPLYVEFNWSGVTLTRQTESTVCSLFVVSQLNMTTTTALCEPSSLLRPDNLPTRTVIASRFMKCSWSSFTLLTINSNFCASHHLIDTSASRILLSRHPQIERGSTEEPILPLYTKIPIERDASDPIMPLNTNTPIERGSACGPLVRLHTQKTTKRGRSSTLLLLLQTSTTIERENANGPLSSFRTQISTERGRCNGPPLFLNAKTTIERCSARRSFLSLHNKTTIVRGNASEHLLPLYTKTTIERDSAYGPLW